MFIARVVRSITVWYRSLGRSETAEETEQEIEEFLARSEAERLQREKEAEEALEDYLAQCKQREK